MPFIIHVGEPETTLASITDRGLIHEFFFFSPEAARSTTNKMV